MSNINHLNAIKTVSIKTHTVYIVSVVIDLVV